jgi:hypothetical protein
VSYVQRKAFEHVLYHAQSRASACSEKKDAGVHFNTARRQVVDGNSDFNLAELDAWQYVEKSLKRKLRTLKGKMD